MAGADRRNLQRIALFARWLALLLGVVVGGQLYARGSGTLPAACAGAVVWLGVHLLTAWLLRRQKALLAEMEADRETPHPPRRKAPRRVRRVLRDRGDAGR